MRQGAVCHVALKPGTAGRSLRVQTQGNIHAYDSLRYACALKSNCKNVPVACCVCGVEVWAYSYLSRDFQPGFESYLRRDSSPRLPVWSARTHGKACRW